MDFGEGFVLGRDVGLSGIGLGPELGARVAISGFFEKNDDQRSRSLFGSSAALSVNSILQP